MPLLIPPITSPHSGFPQDFAFITLFQGEYYEGIEENSDLKRYCLPCAPLDNAPWEDIRPAAGSRFRMAYDAENIYIELFSPAKETFILSPEFRLLWPNADVVIQPEGTLCLTEDGTSTFGLFKDRAAEELKKYQLTVFSAPGTHMKITVRRSDVGLETIRPFKLKITAAESSWCREETPVYTLGKTKTSPGDFGWILP